jgi:hypothetical protein
VIVYLWTAPGSDTAAFHRASGVSDDHARACHVAEVLLRTGQAHVAYVECVYTAMGAATLSLCYVPTGTAWSARLGAGGQVIWTAYTAAPGGRQPGAPAGPGEVARDEELDEEPLAQGAYGR